MHYKNITEHEARFTEQLTDSAGTKYTEEIITENGFTFHRIRPIGIKNYYKKEITEKNMIVLHLTEGYLKGDLAALMTDNNTVCTNFLVARNGTVYELFDQKYWGWHLGRGSIGGNKTGSSRSFAIELSNAGTLSCDGNFLYDYHAKYCALSDTDEYIKLDTPYRGVQYFATCTPEQYEITEKLLNYLTSKYNIPKTFIPEKNRYNLFSDGNIANSYTGICTHANFRSTGKWDIGPAFNWKRITEREIIDTQIELPNITITAETALTPVKRPDMVLPPPHKTTEDKGIFSILIELIANLFNK